MAIPAPGPVRRLLSFARLSSPALATVARVVDEDAAFRARVAKAAGSQDQTELARPGWLWLHRPEGWADDATFDDHPDAADTSDEEESPARLRREREGAEAAASRARQRADAAEATQQRMAAQLAEARSQAGDVKHALEDLRRDRVRLDRERNQAVRGLKAVEAQLAGARHQLKLARAATVQAEVDLHAERRPVADRGDAPVAASAAERPAMPSGATEQAAPDRAVPVGSAEQRTVRSSVAGTDRAIDPSEVGRAVAAAARDAAALSASLAQASTALGWSSGSSDSSDSTVVPGSTVEPNRAGPSARRRRRGAPPPRATRRRPPIPPGVVRGTPEADRHVLGAGSTSIVVDGYNLARTAWSGLDPEEERRRTVVLLEELAARTGGPVIVVFDGNDHTIGPAASRSVRVRFSATGQTADDAILVLVGALDEQRPVVVVSSDREVADGASGLGAQAMSSAAFLTAVGR